MQDVDEQILGPTVYDDILFAPLNYGVPKARAEAMAQDVIEKIEYRDRFRGRSFIISRAVKRRRWPWQGRSSWSPSF